MSVIFKQFTKKKTDILSNVRFTLVREAGLEFQVSGIYGIFETFIRTKCLFCIKYSNISSYVFYPYPVKGSRKGKNKGNFLAYLRTLSAVGCKSTIFIFYLLAIRNSSYRRTD